MVDRNTNETTTRMDKRSFKKKKINKKKKYTAKRIALIVSLTILVCTGLFIYFVYDFFFVSKNDVSFREIIRINKDQKSKDLPPFTKLNILIIGHDSELNGRPRSDTLMLVSFDLKEKAVGILSIPRDTRVLMPGKEVHSKINAAFAEGGANKAVDTVSSFLGVPIQYYVSTNFDGFNAMIDTLGGVEIDVKEDMWYEDKAGGFVIDIKKGKQVLTGEQAIGYVRFRDVITADIGRINRQQEFINQAVKQFLSPDLLIKFPTLLSQFNHSIKTDLSFTDMANLAKLVKDISPNNIKTATLPGTGDYVNDVAYFLHDPDKTQQLVNDLIASKEYVANSKYRLVVFNGNGVVGGAGIMRDELKLHGYDVARIANADNYNYQKTQVIYTKELTKEIKELASIINGELITFDESSFSRKESYADFDALVIVGKDFKA